MGGDDDRIGRSLIMIFPVPELPFVDLAMPSVPAIGIVGTYLPPCQ